MAGLSEADFPLPFFIDTCGCFFYSPVLEVKFLSIPFIVVAIASTFFALC